MIELINNIYVCENEDVGSIYTGFSGTGGHKSRQKFPVQKHSNLII
jgi:hypothetical protein